MSLKIALIAMALAAVTPGAETNRAGTTSRIDPKDLDRAKVVENPQPIEKSLVGLWDLWVPGGIWYSSDGRTIFQHYTPGAAMNKLLIETNGNYTWAEGKGKLVEVRPWHAQEGRRYYRVQQKGGAEYEFYLNAEGKLVFLFAGVGGHAATGTRIEQAPANPPPVTKQPEAGTSAPSYALGAKVEVLWGGQWYAAKVLKREGDRFQVHYEGWDSSWDEWVNPDRIRPPGKKD